MRRLNLIRQLDDSAIEEIAKGCKALSDLNLSKCESLTGKAMDSIITELIKLETLQICKNDRMILEFTKVEKLRNLKKLKNLNLSCTAVTDSILFILLEKLPNLKVLLLNSKKMFY